MQILRSLRSDEVGMAAQDLAKDVVRIDAIPQQSLDTIRVRTRMCMRPFSPLLAHALGHLLLS